MPDRITPTYYENIGAMLTAKISIIASCQKCRQAFDVDLRVMAVLHGLDATLIGKHPPCRIFDCDGHCILLVSSGEGTPRVTLDRWLRTPRRNGG